MKILHVGVGAECQSQFRFSVKPLLMTAQRHLPVALSSLGLIVQLSKDILAKDLMAFMPQ